MKKTTTRRSKHNSRPAARIVGHEGRKPMTRAEINYQLQVFYHCRLQIPEALVLWEREAERAALAEAGR